MYVGIEQFQSGYVDERRRRRNGRGTLPPVLRSVNDFKHEVTARS